MVIYFTGTGNSRYIAKTIAKQTDDTEIDAAKLMKKSEAPAFKSDKPYIFVSPVYAWKIPRIFENWMKKCRFEGNKKAYFVLTCGQDIGAAGNYTKRLASNMGFEYMGTAEVVMPENYLVMFSPPSEDEDEEIFSKATKHTLKLCGQISAQMPFDKVKITFTGHICSDIVTPFFYAFYIGAKKFYATDACVSCGKCVENCMTNNITMKAGKPQWGKACTHCMSCICRCPTEAIEYGKKTKGRRRYVCRHDRRVEK